MLKTYTLGFVLALGLTLVPFALVASKALPQGGTLIAIAVFAIVQILVHLRYFLHLTFTSAPRENLVSAAFTTLLIVIMIGGSVVIMTGLHYRMMPM